MNLWVRAAGIAVTVLGVGAITTHAAPLHGQMRAISQTLGGATDLARATGPTLSVGARPLADQVETYGRTATDNSEQDCLANAVYFEARGEPIEGQLAVAQVVLNRAASGRYPSSICGVVIQPWQFSFARRGVIPAADRTSDAWRKAVAIARIAQDGVSAQVGRDVLWYHANYVAPSWGRRLNRTAQIGLHIFYRA